MNNISVASLLSPWKHEAGIMFRLSEIMHFDAAFMFSEIFAYELLHMFAIVYAVNHASWGVDTGHLALCQEPAVVFFHHNSIEAANLLIRTKRRD